MRDFWKLTTKNHHRNSINFWRKSNEQKQKLWTYVTSDFHAESHNMRHSPFSDDLKNVINEAFKYNLNNYATSSQSSFSCYAQKNA